MRQAEALTVRDNKIYLSHTDKYGKLVIGETIKGPLFFIMNPPHNQKVYRFNDKVQSINYSNFSKEWVDQMIPWSRYTWEELDTREAAPYQGTIHTFRAPPYQGTIHTFRAPLIPGANIYINSQMAVKGDYLEYYHMVLTMEQFIRQKKPRRPDWYSVEYARRARKVFKYIKLAEKGFNPGGYKLARKFLKWSSPPPTTYAHMKVHDKILYYIEHYWELRAKYKERIDNKQGGS